MPISQKASDNLREALSALTAWVERAIVPEYGPRKPMPENCRKALAAAHAALRDAEREEGA